MVFKKYLAKIFLAIIFTLFSIVLAQNKSIVQAGGNTYYVSNTGSDTNIGSQSLPFKTVRKAVGLAQAGDTIRIAPGTYPEKISISSKKGTESSPIRIIGESTDPATYPVIEGSDPTYSNTGTDNPVFNISNSTWISLERLKLDNSSISSVLVSASHYITLRRLVIDYHGQAVLVRNKSSHILMEHNDIYQSYPSASTWDNLKSSKWEGGAYVSFGGAGMVTIRNNYIHNVFNGVFTNRDVRVGDYYDANVWIYDNRFENIVDDPFEAESYNFNNHFFRNTLINTHRIASFAPEYSGTGPVYIYGNLMQIKSDPTKQTSSGTINSAMKIDLSTKFFPNGVYFFNNSMDGDYVGTNSYGGDLLSSTLNYYTERNNVYRTLNTVFTKSSLTLKNSSISHNLSNKGFGYNAPNSYSSTDPLYFNLSNEDLRLQSASPARGKSAEISNLLGFSSNIVVPAGSDLGAFQYGESGFKNIPSPSYVLPPNGEDLTFPANTNWLPDTEGGSIPLSGPKWLTSSVTPTTGPVSTSTPVATPIIKQGDANNDNLVNDADYSIWLTNYAKLLQGPSNGDFNNSGKVDGVDYIIWLTNYGK